MGSFFHGSNEQQIQGCVVAEPVPDIYLVELFSWIAGESTFQKLYRIEDMVGWQFYDTAEWMNGYYRDVMAQRWERWSREQEITEAEHIYDEHQRTEDDRRASGQAR